MSLLAAAPAAVLASLAVAAVAHAADPPIKGARYAGTTSQERPVDGRVTSDGKGLQLFFVETFKCSDGTRIKLDSRYVDQRPTIKADGTFDYRKTYSDLPGLRGFRGKHDETQHLTDSFSEGGRRLSVRSTAVLSRPGRTCRSTITIRARARG
jgi:opacity protein-like surface antigen